MTDVLTCNVYIMFTNGFVNICLNFSYDDGKNDYDQNSAKLF